jgi:hypothetical protein
MAINSSRNLLLSRRSHLFQSTVPRARGRLNETVDAKGCDGNWYQVKRPRYAVVMRAAGSLPHSGIDFNQISLSLWPSGMTTQSFGLGLL